jgi:hypothetical protein
MNELPDAIHQIGILLETLVTDISKRQLATPSTSTFTGPFPVKPPIFYGRKNENAITWLFQMNQIFHNRPSSDESKLCFVVSCLADAALGWYHSICTTSASGIRFPIFTWTQFASEITCAFQPPTSNNYYELSFGHSLNLAQFMITLQASAMLLVKSLLWMRRTKLLTLLSAFVTPQRTNSLIALRQLWRRL